ncbi:MAG TPA: hypothetical protein VE960_05255, partial [bacterium]|nr:hypothetical protein [bacterium]
IGISVEGEVRTDAFRMATGGSVGHVLTSDAEGIGTWQAPAAAADSDWTINGDDVYHDVGYVGIGTSTPARRLDILETTQTCARFQNASAGDDFAISVRNEGGTAGGFYAGSGADYFPVVPSALFASAQSGYRGATISAIDEHGLTVSSSGDRALVATTTGGSCAYFGGGDVWVDDLLRVGEFEMSPGSAGHVLTSDASGVGTWQPPAAASDNDWTVVGSDMSSAVSGRVGIGTVSPLAKLGVHSDLSEEALRVSTAGSSVPRMVNLQRTSMPASGNDILQLTVPAGSPEYFQFIEADIGGVERFSVHGDGYVFSSGGGDFYTSDLDTNFPALRGVMTATGSADVVGVYGESTPAAGFGIGGEFVGGRWGVKASVVPEGTGEHYALYGEIDGGPGTNYGVAGLAQNGVGNYGVWGGAAVGSGYAGYFAGDSHTTGTLTAGTKSFKIDHPLDPENKYLMHSSVESDERMNIYNGNVVLDARGEAWVEMPDWFEVLNQDFRYQLTAMDAPGPNLHIAERIANGRFKIAGGTAGMEVSWMVTGVRHDPVAVATPLSVEVDKPAHEAGKYLNPEAYGKPASMGLGHIEVQETATPKRAPARVREMDANDGE